MHSLIKNTGIYALGDVIPRLLSFITFPILTKYLVPEDYAIVSYVNAITTFLPIISILCLNTYYLVFYYKMEDEHRQKELLGNLTIFIAILNILLTIILLLLGKSIFSAIGSHVSFYPYILIAIGINFFDVFGILPAALYRVKEYPLLITILNIIKSTLRMVVTIILVVGFGYKSLGVLYSSLFISAVFWIIFIRITLKNMVFIINITQIKEALAFSLPLLPGSLASYSVSMLDRVFIEKYLNLFDLGIYSVASTIALMLNIFSYGAYKAFEPYFFKIYNSENFLGSFIKVYNLFLAMLLLGCLVLSIFAREFLYYFATPDYQSAHYYVPLILIGILFAAMNMLFGTIMAAQKKTKISSIIAVIGGVISCILNIILLPRIGLFASCLSSAVSFGIMLVLFIVSTKIRMNYWLSLRGIFVTAITIWLFVYKFSFPSVPLSIFIKCIVTLCFMGLIMLLLKLRLRNIKYYFYSN